MSTLRNAATALLCISLAACVPKLDIDDEARILCGEDEACPDGFVCRTAIGRCLPVGVLDAEPPGVAGAVFEPDIGRAGTEFVITVTTSRPLLEPPRAVAEIRTERLPLVVDEDISGSDRWVLRYVATGDEPEGVATVLLDMIDRQGNVAVAVPAGTFAFDFTPPTVVPGTAERRYVPEADNPLTSVDRAREGTIVEVSFTLSEPIADGTEPEVRTTDGALPFVLESRVGLRFIHRATVPAGLEEGSHTVEVHATDQAGNPGRTDVIAFSVDHTPPAAPRVDVPDRIVYRRVPWGTADSGLEPLFTVEGMPGAVEPYDTVRVHAPGPNASEIGRTRADGDGAFGPVPLWGGDRPWVSLSAVDGAGNVSEIVEVRDVTWTASLVGKTAPTTDGNPTVLVTTPRLDGATIQALGSQPARAEAYERAAGLRPGGLAAKTRPQWEEAIGPTGSPVRRRFQPLAYDANRGRAVMFSGEMPFGGGLTTGTFEWDGHVGTWLLRETPVHPPPRRDHGMAFDAAGGVTVLFGGYNGTSLFFAGTWTWDGAAWSRRDASGDAEPPLRQGHVMAYDPDRETVVLFGGRTGATVHDDLWEWDGATGTWTDRTPAARPPARSHHAMAWDPFHRRILIYGGLSEANEALDDLWAWDGETGTWTELDEVESPVGRAHVTMVTDRSRQQIVLHDGGQELQAPQTWIFDCEAQTWALVEPLRHPPTSFPHAMTFDEGRGRVVLYDASFTSGLSAGRTFEFDPGLSNWIERTPEMPVPAARHRHAMAADPTTGEVVLFGGHTGSTTRSDETWLWTGGRWAPVTPDPAPAGRENHAMVSDTIHGRVLLFGGFAGSGGWLNDLWAWDGADRSWRLVPATTRPTERTNAALAFDADRRRVVLFGGIGEGGVTFDDTWEWDVDDDVWIPRSPATRPPARRSHAMAWDADRRRVVLFGGQSSDGVRLSDTWEWDGTDWIPRNPTTGPSARHEHVLVWHPLRRQVVLIGGSTALQLDDVWVWDGGAGTWTEIEPAAEETVLPARGRHAAAFDPRTGSVLVHGGGVTGQRFEDTWRWDESGRHRPATTWTVPLSAIGEDVTPHALDVRLHGGGAGIAPGEVAATTGAVLLAWDTTRLGWRPVDTNEAGPETAEPEATALTLHLEDEATLRSFVHGPDRSIVLAVTPGLPAGGPDPGVVVLRGAELTVRYRR